MTTTPTIGQRITLPDGPTVTLTKITEGVEYGDKVHYLTGINSLGQEITRWVLA
jgi:hypothetical protein